MPQDENGEDKSRLKQKKNQKKNSFSWPSAGSSSPLTATALWKKSYRLWHWWPTDFNSWLSCQQFAYIHFLSHSGAHFDLQQVTCLIDLLLKLLLTIKAKTKVICSQWPHKTEVAILTCVDDTRFLTTRGRSWAQHATQNKRGFILFSPSPLHPGPSLVLQSNEPTEQANKRWVMRKGQGGGGRLV